MSRAATLHKKAYNRRYQAERRAELKAAGLCLWCGKNPGKPSKRSPNGVGVRCLACSIKAATSCRVDLARRRPALRKLGICVVCCCRQAMPKATRCGFCAEQQDATKARARSAEA